MSEYVEVERQFFRDASVNTSYLSNLKHSIKAGVIKHMHHAADGSVLVVASEHVCCFLPRFIDDDDDDDDDVDDVDDDDDDDDDGEIFCVLGGTTAVPLPRQPLCSGGIHVQCKQWI